MILVSDALLLPPRLQTTPRWNLALQQLHPFYLIHTDRTGYGVKCHAGQDCTTMTMISAGEQGQGSVVESTEGQLERQYVAG